MHEEINKLFWLVCLTSNYSFVLQDFSQLILQHSFTYLTDYWRHFSSMFDFWSDFKNSKVFQFVRNSLFVLVLSRIFINFIYVINGKSFSK